MQQRPRPLEYEVDPVTLRRTGRTRKRQFVSYPRPHDQKPIIQWWFR